MMIDIRDDSVQVPEEIRFADDTSANGCILQVIHRPHRTIVQIIDGEGLGDNRILIENIDNFIKALKKGKELWG